jgi:hypothetical protein
MNNAENHAAVEIKRKAAKEDARYDLVERGESAKRNFEKIDKPHDENEEKQRTADSLTSLPPEDLRNVGVLALLCMILFKHADDRFVAGRACWLGVWEYSVFVEVAFILWTSGNFQSGFISLFYEIVVVSDCGCDIQQEIGT